MFTARFVDAALRLITMHTVAHGVKVALPDRTASVVEDNGPIDPATAVTREHNALAFAALPRPGHPGHAAADRTSLRRASCSPCRATVEETL